MNPQSATERLAKRLSQARRHAGKIGAFVLLALAGGALLSCVSIDRVVTAPPSVPGAEFVGNETCSECHDGIVKDFATAAHSWVMHPTHEDLNIGCESCHGAGSLHAETGGAPFSIVNPKRDPETCFQCHLNLRGQFNLPYHHPLEAGKVSCSDCHDPHEGPAMLGGGTLLAGANETCLKCHASQGGPHVFEHEAVRDGCVTCHSPHGSVNQKMLTERNANLCMKCHVQQQAGGGTFLIGAVNHRSFLSRGTCWSGGCHEAVHGSQVSSSLRF